MCRQTSLTTKKFNLALVLFAILFTSPLVINQLIPTSSFNNLAFASTNLKQIKIGTKDTLWSIARDNRENTDLTIKQTMLAIKDANPHAFPSNNINEMEPHSTLTIPSAVVISQRTAYQAEIEVRRENQAWVAAKNQAAKPKPQKKPAAVKPIKTQAATPKKSTPTNNTQLKNQVKTLEAENAQLNKDLNTANQEITSLQNLVNLKDSQLDELETKVASRQATSTQPAAASPQVAEDTSLTSKMNREPWLYGGYATAIFFSLTFLITWLFARGRANFLEKELAKSKQQTLYEVPAYEEENLTNFAELSSSEEAALNSSLEEELAAKPANNFTSTSSNSTLTEQSDTSFTEDFVQEEDSSFAELEAEFDNELQEDPAEDLNFDADLELDIDDLDLDDLDLSSLDIEETPVTEEVEATPVTNDQSETSDLDDLVDLEATEVDLTDDLADLDINLNEDDFNENDENITKLGLDELVETDLGSLDDIESLEGLNDLDLTDNFDNLEADLEAPLASEELSANEMLGDDFEEVKYESDADEFLEALDSIEDDDLAALEEELTSEEQPATAPLAETANTEEELDDEAHEVDTLASNLTSQLDLASAYIEMGDKAGAKEILDKLVTSDNAEIQIKAQQLLETLA